MILRDMIALSAGNLLRMRLRATLTIAGVVIAIGAFVAMLSFGAGNQRYVRAEFENLGLFHTMRVFPVRKTAATDTTARAVLDNAVLRRLGGMPGVRLVFPYDAFTANVILGDSQMTAKVQALSQEALHTKWFSHLRAGSVFAGDSAREAIVAAYFLRQCGIKYPDSALGKPLVLNVRLASIDSGLARVFPPKPEYLRRRWHEIWIDSLFVREYVRRQVRAEVNNAMRQFVDGWLNARALVSDTLVICGVIAAGGGMAPVMIPAAAARRFSGGVSLDDPAALVGALQSGQLLGGDNGADGKTYPHLTLDLDPAADQKMLADSIRAMGFRPFSLAEEFKEIQKFFFYFDLALSVIGIIALVTASLGIVNTLVMSILERRKEIGILKSLGADERDISVLFLVESVVIGFVGAVFGILLGWVISRVASAVGQAFMAREGIEGIDLFALPPWLILAALAVGMVTSLLAGLYPAARAAHVDPVEALRNE
ncbi:MAG: FtsX-like permease family protein [Candidatus Zixiibacteriota bacterium]